MSDGGAGLNVRYQVFVERTQDSSPQGVRRVAENMSKKMGIAVEPVLQRLMNGRFAARTGLGKDAAASFARELEELGLVCSVSTVPGSSALPGQDMAAPPLGIGTSPGRPKAPVARAAPRPPMGSKPLPPLTAQIPGPNPVNEPVEESLVTFTPPSAPSAPSLEAFAPPLEPEDPLSGNFTLSNVDGSEESQMSPAAANGGLPPLEANLDQFRPPEMAQEEMADLAPDMDFVQKAEESRTISTFPAGQADEASTEGPGLLSKVQMPTFDKDAAMDKAKSFADTAKEIGTQVKKKVVYWFNLARFRTAGSERLQFAVGGLLAVFLCFLPAHIVASIWEGSTYGGLETELQKSYDKFAVSWEYHEMTLALEKAKGAASSSRIVIGLVGVLIWAAVAAGFLYWWFTKVDWRKYLKHPSYT